MHELSLRSSLQRLRPDTGDANEERRRDLLTGGHPSRDPGTFLFKARGNRESAYSWYNIAPCMSLTVLICHM